MDAAEYYKLRAEHTIQHLQQASRLIYFVSGAVVAMLYFVVDKMKEAPAHRAFTIGLLVVLGVVNAMHGRLIIVQARWYHDFDAELAKCVGVTPLRRKSQIGAMKLFAGIHWVVSVAAIGAAIYLLCTKRNGLEIS